VALNASVHYVSHGTPVQTDGKQAFASVCRAADVTECSPHDWFRVGLCVKNPTGFFFHPLAAGGSAQAPQDDATGGLAVLVPGSWHWPDHCPNQEGM
jgi:hypothetical protein